jgi:hypothetical protein
LRQNNGAQYGAKKYLKDYDKVKKVYEPKPVALCDWKTLIDAMRQAVSVLEAGKGRDIRKSNTFAFYNDAVQQFSRFKDAWRNHVSHGREPYDHYDAKRIMDNTEHFIQLLAARLKERK